MRYLFMSRSLTYAQRTARFLEKSGIPAFVIKAPKGTTENGCAYSVSVAYKNGDNAARLLKNEGLLNGKVFHQDSGGNLREVDL